MVIRSPAPRRSDTPRRWARRVWITGIAGSLLAPLAVWMATDLVTAAAVAQLTGLAVAVLAIFGDLVTGSSCPEPDVQSNPGTALITYAAAARRGRFGMVVCALCVVLLVGLPWWTWITGRWSRG
jgi:predicted lysophospholipase L1 biosynthesis ABC-type transport system permease subunit